MNLWKFIIGDEELKAPEAKFHTWSEDQQQAKVNHWLELIQPYERTAFKPLVETCVPEFSPHSKMGGFPFLHREEDWPKCPNCQRHMQLFLQLNLKGIPERRQDGLLQFFYCTSKTPNCEELLQAHKPYSPGGIVHWVPSPEGESVQIEPDIEQLFPEKRIDAWKPLVDYPSFEELRELGVDIPLDDYALLEHKQVAVPFGGDKLFGWPLWADQMNYPFDRQTRSRMEQLFQFASRDHLPWSFGEIGVCHLHESPDQPDHFCTEWSCPSQLD